jgi:Co/Zn/Cd efflux system component
MAEYLDEQLRRAVILVAVLNLAYFWIEFATALTIGSVALLADSADFLEDASVNLLILVALGWSATRRARVGILLSGVLLLPAIAFLGHSGRKFMHQCRLRRHLSRWWV